MKRTTRRATAALGAAALAIGCLALIIPPRPSALASAPVVGISMTASLAELYAYLQVPIPRAAWAPVEQTTQCSSEWVAWSSGLADAQKTCRGKWNATRSNQCRNTSICACQTYRQCTNGRILADVCDSASNCARVLFQRNVPTNQIGTERLNCKNQSRDTAVAAAVDGSPYHYWWRVRSNATFNFICEAQYVASKPRVARVPACGCETASLCECSTDALRSPVALTWEEAKTALGGQLDADDYIKDQPRSCETLQDDNTLTVEARYQNLLAGGTNTDTQSRTAFEHTTRLMHELDMVRPAADAFMQSALATPSCGVTGWLTAPTTCTNQVPIPSFLVSNNCARLLSSHVVGPTITEDVYRQCTEALRTIALATYTDPTCLTMIREGVASFAAALRDKALNSSLMGSGRPEDVK